MRGQRIGTLLTALLISACAEASPPSGPPTDMSPSARQYLNTLLDIMQQHALGRHDIDWPQFRQDVVQAAGIAQTVLQLRPAIRRALELLDDGQSVYLPGDGAFPIVAPPPGCTAAPTTTPALPPGIGYVRVNAFGSVGAAAVAYAEDIRAQIEAVDGPDVVGWIVDLRGNDGNNMWPMLSGVGPILGEGTAGWFIDSDGVEMPWSFHDNTAWFAETPVQTQPNMYRLFHADPRVAVLTDGAVARSGEGIAVAFRARPQTRTFGTATCGLSTANSFFLLSDGAVLSLIVAVMADRTKQAYGDVLLPDEVVDTDSLTVVRAVEWLQQGERSGN